MSSILVSKDQLASVESFLRSVDGLSVIPCDVPERAEKGFTSFTINEDGTEVSVDFYYQFAKVPTIVTATVANGEELLRRCIDESGWIDSDYPRDRLVGFAKYAEIDSDEESEMVYIPITVLKQLSQGIQEELNDLRYKHEKTLIDYS